MNPNPLLQLINTRPLEWTIEETTKGLKYAIGCTDDDGTLHLIQDLTYEKGLELEVSLPKDKIPKLSLSKFIRAYVYYKYDGDTKNTYALKEKYSVCKSGTIARLLKKSRYFEHGLDFS